MVLLWLAIVIVYFIPSMIASGRRNNGGIIALNILLGWTLLGWVGSLIWALSAPRK